MPFTWLTVRPGRSTPTDLVQSRYSQTGPRSVSELESVLTLNNPHVVLVLAMWANKMPVYTLQKITIVTIGNGGTYC